ELPERWSMQRKMELVLRLLRGEALDAVSRDSQIPAHELEGWKRVFLETGARGLKTRAEPEERDSMRCSASSSRIISSPIFARARVKGLSGPRDGNRCSYCQ